VNYFEGLAKETGLPYQKLIDLYPADLAKKRKKLTMKCAAQRKIPRHSRRLVLWANSQAGRKRRNSDRSNPGCKTGVRGARLWQILLLPE
jgi:hypothetical protein